MNIPAAAVEVSAELVGMYLPCEGTRDDKRNTARAVIKAALPILREAIAQEIEAELATDDNEHRDAKMFDRGANWAVRIIRDGI